MPTVPSHVSSLNPLSQVTCCSSDGEPARVSRREESRASLRFGFGNQSASWDQLLIGDKGDWAPGPRVQAFSSHECQEPCG